jgi:predicted RNase H-like HicB family nuclease
MRIFQVAAHWDPEARVWWAESDDVPGLVAEAETLDAMTSDLRELVPELLRINLGLNEKSIQFRLVADRVEDVHQA